MRSRHLPAHLLFDDEHHPVIHSVFDLHEVPIGHVPTRSQGAKQKNNRKTAAMKDQNNDIKNTRAITSVLK